MKIKDLKNLINKLPPEMDELEIWNTISSGCCGEFEELGEMEVQELLPTSNNPGGLRIHFNESLPGYKSCIQVSQTKENDIKYWSQFSNNSEKKTDSGESF